MPIRKARTGLRSMSRCLFFNSFNSFIPGRCLRIVYIYVVVVIGWTMASWGAPAVVSRWDGVPNPDTSGLPQRTVAEQIPQRPVPPWTQTHLRIGHLPGSLPMAAEFLKAGYNVVTLNVLGKWDVVGPSAGLYAPDRVREAEEYMRTHVERCHAAGA